MIDVSPKVRFTENVKIQSELRFRGYSIGLRKLTIVLYKGKGTKMECSNYRPIRLLSVPGKVFANVLLERVQPLIDMTRRPEQSGFVAGRSTVDAILALRLLSDLHREFDHPLNVAFLDIKAAFDSVNR